jgi:hypothetical protein
VQQAGYTVGNEETIGFFLNGLSLSILEEVIRDPFPQNYNEYKAKVVNITKGRQMIELIRARQGIPNLRGFNNTFRQNQNQFRPQAWGGIPNRTNKDRNNNNSNSSKGQATTPPPPHTQHTTMSKYPWMNHAPEHHITDASTEATMPTPIPPSHKTSIAMWQTLQGNRTINANAPKDLALTVERWGTSPRTATARTATAIPRAT